ncbi:hypothetical protein HCN44_004793 [Aphidius gifuensis]|uniref:Uncharacterized protein n=1 Tax=Aphidius gifuensis TaxID=684658 RepID=A0A835CL78_APHGI|nr:hypothetical protein HCN44_004793 [Aphidius gifuensis]
MEGSTFSNLLKIHTDALKPMVSFELRCRERVEEGRAFPFLKRANQLTGTDWRDQDDRALADHDAPYNITSNGTFQITKSPMGRALIVYKITPLRHIWDGHLDGAISDKEMDEDEDDNEEIIEVGDEDGHADEGIGDEIIDV